MVHLAKRMQEEFGTPFQHVSYFGIEDTAKALYDVAEAFQEHDAEIMSRTRMLVRDEVRQIMPELRRLRADLIGKRAAIYTGGAFKAFSLVRALRTLGMDTVVAGSQTGSKQDYEQLKEICDDGAVLIDDANPVELAKFIREQDVDLFIGGVKERPLAFKLGVAFCDHNHERKHALAGFAGMLNFAREVHATTTSPVWKFAPRRAGRLATSAASTAANFAPAAFSDVPRTVGAAVVGCDPSACGPTMPASAIACHTCPITALTAASTPGSKPA
jgi:nitrogenase molybdenum-cofactor synthesis protein NifE